MKSLTKVLRKKKWLLLYNYTKRPHLFEKNKRIAGKVLCVVFNKFSTIFEVADFVKQSKKQRSNVVDIQIKDIFQYNFIGICIAQKKDEFVLNTNFLIRNTFDKVPYEMTISLYSPIIDSIYVYPLIEKFVYITHNKYYYLRKKPMPMSTIFFDYVTDMFENDTIQENENLLKDLEKKFITNF